MLRFFQNMLVIIRDLKKRNLNKWEILTIFLPFDNGFPNLLKIPPLKR